MICWEFLSKIFVINYIYLIFIKIFNLIVFNFRKINVVEFLFNGLNNGYLFFRGLDIGYGLVKDLFLYWVIFVGVSLFLFGYF